MASLGKKRNKPTVQARLRGLASQVRKVELAEPVLRQRQTHRRHAQSSTMPHRMGVHTSVGMGDSAGCHGFDSAAKPQMALASASKLSRSRPAVMTSRSIRSEASEYTKRVTRNEIIKKKRNEEDGMWDRILTFNQQEGQRIAALAAEENMRRRCETKKYLDDQVAIGEKRKEKDQFAQLRYVKEQKLRLKKLEAEEERKELLMIEKARNVKEQQDEMILLVKKRKQAEIDRQRREGEEMMKKIHEDELEDRAKQANKLRVEKERAKELKRDLEKQLALKEEMRKFEAQEEKMLQRAARKKAEQEEARRKAALDELFAKMKSKQKIGESTAADVAAIAQADEARAKQHQAQYDEKCRKEAEAKRRKAQEAQKSILESLEQQLLLKTQAQERELAERQEQAIQLKKDSVKAFEQQCAERDAEQAKKHKYFAELTQQINENAGDGRRTKYSGMSDIERAFNKRVITKMENQQFV